MKRFLSILLCLGMVLSLFAGCGDQNATTVPTTQHKHSYSKTWSGDESGHWYAADCGCDLKANQGEHTDGDVDGVCDICAWKYTCKDTGSTSHTFATDWTSDTTHHWHSSTCDHYGAVSEKAEHSDEDNDGACDVCAYTGDHTHTFQDSWSSDDKQHWHDASCGHAVKNGVANHVDYANDGVCDVCGWFDASHNHSFGTEWVNDVVYHWHGATCEHTGAMADRAEHADTDGDKHCDVCNFEICEHADYDEDGQCDLCGWADPNHSHTFEQMLSDKNHHWFVATCHPGAISEKLPHVDTNVDGICDECQFQICGHSFAAEWSSDDTHHWKAILCTCNIPRKDYAPHNLDANGVCEDCMYGYVTRSAYEVIMENVPYTIVMDAMITWAEFKVNFPQPGRYVITLINPNGAQDIRITDNPNGEVNRQNDGFTVEVTEAGEMSLWFRVFDIQYTAGKELPITYSVVRSDDLVVDTLKGKVELPTNTVYKLLFTAPEVGEYKMITSVEGLVIGLTEDSMEYFKGHISFTVTEVGQEFIFYIVLNDVERKSFIFDWILEPPFCLNVDGEGNYAVSVAPGQIDYKVEFTAPVAGYYTLAVDSKWLTFCYWSETHNQPVRGDGDLLEKQQVLTGWLEEGEVFTTWLQTVYNYPDSVNCRDTLTVTNIGQMVEYGDFVATPGMEGSKYSFQSTSTVYYCLQAEGGQIGVIAANGKISWVDYYEVKVAAGYSYTFMVRGEGEVKVTMNTKVYEMTLEGGTNTITMAPAKEYDVIYGNYELLDPDGNPTGNMVAIDPNKSIVKLSWTNSRLMVYVNGVQVASGTEVELLHSVVTIKAMGSAEVEVEIQLEVMNPQPAELTGETNATLQVNQEIKLLLKDGEPATATFTAEHGGSYVFTCKGNVTVNVYIRSATGEERPLFSTKDNGSGSFQGEYVFQLEVGESITFAVKTSATTDTNAYVMISPK